MAPEVTLLVNGRRYSGWKSIRITRSIESLAGSFALDVSDKWRGDQAPWPIKEGDACRVYIDSESVINGCVYSRKLAVGATERTLSYSGRDRTGDVVDSSVLVPDSSTKGHKWTYRNTDIAAFARAIAGPHGVSVSVQPGLVLPKDPLLVAHPGETCFEAIKRATGSASVIVISDGDGGILITRVGTQRVTALVEGANIKTAEIDYNATERFYKYYVSSQPPGTDESNGESLRVQAEATDLDVTRTNRVLVVRPDKGMDTAMARRRADWEARVRAAKSAAATIGVQGWRQPDGTLWPINSITHVSARRSLDIDGDMLISQVEYSVGEAGTMTSMSVVRPDALTPEPQTAVVASSANWNLDGRAPKAR
jgi:prophage tail gpP-like protein